MIKTITNLYPYPEQPTRGLFNMQLFRELDKLTETQHHVLVANTNPLKASHIKRWVSPAGLPAATYIPYQHIPLIGRNISWKIISRVLKNIDFNCAPKCSCEIASREPVAGGVETCSCGIVSREPVADGVETCGGEIASRQTTAGGRTDRRAAHGMPDGHVRDTISQPHSQTLGQRRDTISQPHSQTLERGRDTISQPHFTLPPSQFTLPPPTILASWLYPDGTAAADAFKNSDAHVWTMVLGTDRFHLNSNIRKKAIMQADKHTAGYICVSENIANDLIFAGISSSKVHIIRNGVNTQIFHPNIKTRPQAIDHRPQTFPSIPASPIILWIGNLVPIKAPDVALKAFAKFIKSKPESSPDQNQSLVFIGDGPMRSRLDALSQKLGIQDRIHFQGRCPHDKIPYWLNAADCLLLSSHSEGMPNAIAEALACGCPVVATDVGACSEMLKNQPCCKTVPANNHMDMSKALEIVINESKQTQKRPAFKRTWADMAKGILELISLQT